ncbi:cell division protein FtsZ [Alkalilacustris brevis]|uniref:cell division protein FtsZ n=1 Tax=Alkalilacustris brevis TaxID=2026338 RepID=UPI000E0D6294|nr:cell division protein FtsZ [Alkalilacustris brevis]
MALNLIMTEREELTPRITVFGVGGAGGNAVNNMIEQSLEGVEFVVANTDAQALQQNRAQARIQMGVKVTEGLGAGARASVGAAAAEEAIEEIIDHLAGAHMCFITAGMGGGTGTGAAPIIAQAARELGVLTVGVVTKPFQFEGAKRMRQAEEGVEALQQVVDTLIIIPNQNLFRLANEKTTFTEAFALADDVLYQGVKGVTDLMVRPGLINLDFADVRAVMDEMGKAMMGTGEAEGEERAIQAAEKAIANPLLDEISLNGARGVLINITGGHDLTLFELDEAANLIREKVDQDANIIVGSTLDPTMEGRMRVSVVATGIDASQVAVETPVPRRRLAEPLQPMTLGAGDGVASQEHANEEFAAPEEPQHEEVAQDVAEPTLFDPVGEYDQGAHQQAGYTTGGYETGAPPARPRQAADDLPPPAYNPQQAAPRPAAASHEDDAASFVAPRPRAPGAPSPEALARLRAAVSKVPGEEGGQQRPAAAPAQAPAAGGAAGDKSRFGINSLISRMTGQGGGEAAAGARAQQPGYARQQPRLSGHEEEDEEMSAEQERIEIPAFLRRQAN